MRTVLLNLNVKMFLIFRYKSGMKVIQVSGQSFPHSGRFYLPHITLSRNIRTVFIECERKNVPCISMQSGIQVIQNPQYAKVGFDVIFDLTAAAFLFSPPFFFFFFFPFFFSISNVNSQHIFFVCFRICLE